jgi:hypothetical protein
MSYSLHSVSYDMTDWRPERQDFEQRNSIKPFTFGNFSYTSVLRVSLYSTKHKLRKTSYDSSAFRRLQISASVNPCATKNIYELSTVFHIGPKPSNASMIPKPCSSRSHVCLKNPYLFFPTVLYNKAHTALFSRFTLPAFIHQSLHFVDSWLHLLAFSN